MPNIFINDLRSIGSQLFTDSESFMDELTSSEQEIMGGQDVFKTVPVLTIKQSLLCDKTKPMSCPEITAPFDPPSISCKP